MRLSANARRVGRALLLGVAVSVAVTALSRLGALAGWETRAVDAFVFLRPRVPVPEVVLVVNRRWAAEGRPPLAMGVAVAHRGGVRGQRGLAPAEEGHGAGRHGERGGAARGVEPRSRHARLGLPEQAAEAYEEAQFLSTRDRSE